MPEIRSHADELARLKARTGPTLDEKISAMEGGLSRTMLAVEGLVARKDAKAKDDDDKHEDDKRRYDDLDKRIDDAIARAFRKYDRRRHEDDNVGGQEGEAQEMASDDEAEDEGAEEETPEGVPLEGGAFRERGSTEDRHHDARRPDRRADAVADGHRLAEFQKRADRVCQMHGRSLERPRLGDTYKSYLPRTLNQLAYHCLPRGHQLHRADFRLNKDPRQLEDLKERVLTDGEAAAYDPSLNASGREREVVRFDQAGRKIIEFCGPPSQVWPGEQRPSCLDMFKAPPVHAQLNRELINQSNQMDMLAAALSRAKR